MEFNPITTQEQLDAVIGERIKREKETLAKKYGDYDSLKTKVADYEKQIGDMSKAAEEAGKKYAGYDKVVADLQKQIKGYESSSVKTRIAHETGLPYELAGRLSGDTEDDIRRDAESLLKVMGSQRQAPPLASTEMGVDIDTNRAAMKGMLAGLMKGE